MWLRLAGLSGTEAAAATLAVAAGNAFDQLGRGAGEPLQFFDVTGDGVADVIASAIFADGPAGATGAVYVWSVSAGQAPLATLSIPGAVANDQIGFASGQGVQLVDLTGDGLLDILVGASGADLSGAVDAGALYLWTAPEGLSGEAAPDKTFTAPAPGAGDRLSG